jgi:hypothetical protein
MLRKYREIKPWRKVHFASNPCQCDRCNQTIDAGGKYERRVYEERSETGNTLAIIVMREHLSPCCNQYER